MSFEARCAVALAAGMLAAVSPVSAQGLETLGNRAAAMAAFVAVADDASAVAWNPSGLVSGPFFNVQLDLGRFTNHPDDPPLARVPAGRTATTLVAIGTTPLGLAYYRILSTSFANPDPEAEVTPDRQDGRLFARTLVTSHLGATVQQSIGDYVTLGATLKLVRGSVGFASLHASSWDSAFAQAESLERDGTTRGDLDVGAMFAAGQIRAGVVVRNVTAPSFGADAEPDARVTLERHARIGVAWADRWPGISATVLSLDADVTRVPSPTGERRDVAVGAERWLFVRRVGVRGGVRASTIGDARTVVSVGGSFAVRAGTYVDAFFARGANDGHAWGVATRFTY